MAYDHMDAMRTVRLLVSQKAVLMWLCRRADAEGLAFPSQQEIADATCISVRQVRRILIHLVSIRLISHAGHRARGVDVYKISERTPDVRSDPLSERTSDVWSAKIRPDISQDQSGHPSTSDRTSEHSRPDTAMSDKGGRNEKQVEGEGDAHSKETDMGPLRSRGCIINHRDPQEQLRLRAEWKNACRALTHAEVAEIIDTGGKPVQYAKDFIPLRSAWEQRTGWVAPAQRQNANPEEDERTKADAADKVHEDAKREAAKRRTPDQRAALCAILDPAKSHVLEAANA